MAGTREFDSSYWAPAAAWYLWPRGDVSQAAIVDDTYRRPYITAGSSPLHLNTSPLPFRFFFSPPPPLLENQTHTCILSRLHTSLLSDINHAGCSERRTGQNSFKISFNYRPRRAGETFFWTGNYSFCCCCFYYKDWRYMKNLCPSRREKDASGGKGTKKKPKSVSLMTTARQPGKGPQGDW